MAAVAQDFVAGELDFGRAAGDGRNEREDIAIANWQGIERLSEIADVLVAQKDVHEVANAATVIEELSA